MVGKTIGRYRVLARRGGGAMGAVWEAEDLLLGRRVALKTISPDLVDSAPLRRRFLHEARAAALLDHPSIAAVHESGEADGVLFIAFALLDGETVHERLQRGIVEPPEAARVAAAVADALSHAHGRGVIHRDVSSNNVVLGAEGRVWLVDFGLALAPGLSRLTSTESVLGTLPYLSPEAFQEDTADPRSDLYGLGVVLFEMLTGTLPHRADRREALIYAILNTPAPSVTTLRPAVPEAVAVVVSRCLAKRREDRFQAADEVGRALRATGVPDSPRDHAPSDSIVEAGTAGRSTLPAGHRVLAVLPFTSVVASGSAIPDEESAAGFAEAVSAALATTTRIDVLPPVALGTGESAARLARARQLGATVALTGSVRRSAHRIRVSVALIDLSRMAEVAGESLEGSWADLFALEDALVARVRDTLGLPARDRAPARGRVPSPADRERYMRALGYLQRADNEASVEGAIRLLEGLVESGSDSAEVNAALGRACLAKSVLTAELSWVQRAAAACQRALERDPDSPEALILLGSVYLHSGRLEEAAEVYERVVAHEGERFEALDGQARAFERLERFPEAEDACRRAIAQRPGSWAGYDRLGAIYYHQGRYAQAIEPWRRVTRITPDNSRGHYRLAAALFHLDRFEDAIEAYRRSIEIQPTAEAWTSLGTVLYYSARYDEAADAFEKAVGLKPAEPREWGNLAAACARLPGREARGREALDRAIALTLDRLAQDPRRAEDWAWLACWRADRGARQEAEEAVERALNLAPGDVNVLAQAGVAFHLMGDRARALRWIGEAVRRGYGVKRLVRDPDLASLTADPEFQRIVAERGVKRVAEA